MVHLEVLAVVEGGEVEAREAVKGKLEAMGEVKVGEAWVDGEAGEGVREEAEEAEEEGVVVRAEVEMEGEEEEEGVEEEGEEEEEVEHLCNL
mmetsp:Transcript_31407/g.59031  ORF Transcript_31407/g.59031 Transcript_31407/m.59031 type:complete len:92 (+) Transcript_31407:706-981(+)